MGIALKLTAVGNSTGVILPKEVLAGMKTHKGDTVYLTETPDGYLLTPYDERFVRQVEAAPRAHEDLQIVGDRVVEIARREPELLDDRHEGLVQPRVRPTLDQGHRAHLDAGLRWRRGRLLGLLVGFGPDLG